jgi:adhesin transport system outer membrane protein
VLRTRELLALAHDSVATHESILARINDRVAGGRSSGADAQQAQGRLALAKANVEASIGDVKTAEAAYLEAVGEMPNNPSKDAAPFASVPANTRAAVDRAMANSPVIKSAMADIVAAKAEKAEANCRFCPRVEAELGASRNYNLDGTEGWNNDQTAMVYYRQNLYNGGYDTAQVAEREERVKEAVDQLEADRRSVEKAVIESYADMSASQARLQPLATHVESSLATRDAFIAQFDLGQRTLLDLLDSEVELVNARAALITGKYQADAGAYGVLAYTGDLVPAAAANQVASK